jgi:hypothetical protein
MTLLFEKKYPAAERTAGRMEKGDKCKETI